MKCSIRYQFNYPLVLLNVLPILCSFSQIDSRQLIKVGGFPTFTVLSGFSINIEREKVFKRNRSFSHGPRLDYNRKPATPQSSTVFFPGIENLVLGYQVKFYPFYFKSLKPYHGVFIGIDPCYFTPINKKYKYGPGIGSLIGYQYIFKNKISAGFEGSVIYMQNTNDQSIYRTNPQDRYFYFILNVKVGIKLPFRLNSDK